MEISGKTVEPIEKCECGNEETVTEEGRIYCNECGMELEISPSMGPERRTFNREQWEETTRTGPQSTPTVHDRRLSTVIGWENKDSHGQRIGRTEEERSHLYKLRKWQKRIRISDAKEANLARALSELDRLADSLKLQSVMKENAASVYRKALEKKFTRGRHIRPVVAACIWYSIRQYEIPRKLSEVSSVSNLQNKDIFRCYRFLINELGQQMPLQDYSKYVSKICNLIGASPKAERIGIKISELTKKYGLKGGKSPFGLSAACVYFASRLTGERLTQREIAQKADVSEVTVRNRYKEIEMHPHLSQEIYEMSKQEGISEESITQMLRGY